MLFEPADILGGMFWGLFVSLLVYYIYKMKIKNISLVNRTYDKSIFLKKKFKFLNILDWKFLKQEIKNFDIIINATSLGLKEGDKIPINFDQIESGKLFYDVIYNPKKTNFLLEAEKRGHQIENGKMMFIYQAQAAFSLFTIAPDMRDGLLPSVNKRVHQLLEND